MSEVDEWLKPKSDQLNADDLIGGKRVIRIRKVKITKTGKQDGTIWFDGDDNKPWKPCVTMGRIMRGAWGLPENWIGKYVEIYRDPEAIYAGKKVGGIRISGLSDIDSDYETSVTVSRSVRNTVRIKKITVAAQPEIPAELLKDGLNAASKGAVEFVKWRDALPADKKEQMRPYNGVWSSQAKAVDAAKTPTTEENNNA